MPALVRLTRRQPQRSSRFLMCLLREGWVSIIRELEQMLVEVTGYAGVSLQPNAGSQGEFAGLMAIRSYHLANGDAQRTVCLIPASAHGTNAASAVMAGMRVVVVKTADDGSVDLADLRAKVKIVVEERRSYDPQGTRNALLRHAGERALCVDTTQHGADDVARLIATRLGEWGLI